MVRGRVRERTFLHWARVGLPAEVDTRAAWSESRHWQSKLVRPDDSGLLAKAGKTRDDAFTILEARLKYAAELLKEYVFEEAPVGRRGADEVPRL